MSRGRKPTNVAASNVSVRADETKETKIPEIKDDENVTVYNKSIGGTKTNICGELVEFDKDGSAEIKGSIAKIILTIPGFYTNAKAGTETPNEEAAADVAEATDENAAEGVAGEE